MAQPTVSDMSEVLTQVIQNLKSDRGDQWLKVFQGILESPVLFLEELRGSTLPLATDGVVQSFGLTPREFEVLLLVGMGDTNKAIAAKLGITEDTVKKYVQSIIAKLRAVDRTHAATIAARAGLLGGHLVSVEGE